jgi:GGDEF domain-containing protein
VIVRGTDVGQAGVLAERLRNAVAIKRVGFDETNIEVTISIVVAFLACCRAGPNGETLLAKAMERLALANKAGPNRIRRAT